MRPAPARATLIAVVCEAVLVLSKSCYKDAQRSAEKLERRVLYDVLDNLQLERVVY